MEIFHLFSDNKKISPNLIPMLLKNIQGDDADKIYKYLEQQEDGLLVLHLMKIMKSIYTKTEFKKNIKCQEKCIAFIREGNALTRKNKVNDALKSYNQAIAFAPQNSSALRTAYEKRSEFYFENGLIKESINDIDICLKNNPTVTLIDKLNKLKLERSKKSSPKEISAKWESDFVREYFKIDKVNKSLPCASELICFTTDDNRTKAVAGKPIKAGTVLAIETAFVHDKEESLTTCCHYCFKQSFNIIPCDDCTSVFFCNEVCKQKCLAAFHKAECSVIDLMESSPSYTYKMAYVAAVKCRMLCNSWEEFIEISENLGEECVDPFSIKDLFSPSKTCLATWQQDKYLHLGRMFNYAMLTAIILGQAKNNSLVIPSNLPLTKTLKSIIKHMMFYQINVRLTRIDVITRTRNTQTIKDNWAIGWFPFIGKLDRECDANCIVVGLDSKAVLIAIKPIAVNEKITVSLM